MRLARFEHSGPEPWVQLRNANFHPLLYKKMVGAADPAARPGDFVTVYNRDGAVFGRGFYNPRSQIALRLLSFAGGGPPVEDLLRDRLADAVRLRRESLRLDAVTDSYRVVHAEGDGLSGLIVDRFGRYLVIELFSLAMYRRLDLLRTLLTGHFPDATVIVRADERIQEAEGFRLDRNRGPAARQRAAVTDGGTAGQAGPAGQADSGRNESERTVITEHGVRFQVEFAGGHKTGFFCDQRDNRLLLSRHTAGAEVLDACSYSGGFGVYAAKLGGAKSVTCVDLDEYAIALAKRNAGLNGVRLDTVHADAFHYLRQMQGNARSFDAVVLDPPKLIASRDGYDEGRAKYFDLNKLGLGVVRPGGLMLTCSCSGLVDATEFFNIVRGAARSAGRRVQVLHFGGPGPDHPVMTECPESLYLKCLLVRVLPLG
jgi:23S rRNA (cytosine1962-C5)-methyltransferase